MNEYMRQHSGIALQLVLFACAITLGAFVAHMNQQEVVRNLSLEIESAEKKLYDIASITDRNGADDAISAIIIDCPRREEYESLLIKLGTLSKKDLVSVQNLNESCGSFFAERKALMVAKLEREFESYETLITLLRAVDTDVAADFDLETWSRIVLLEKERSTLLTDQSKIQEDIITLLISGATLRTSPEVERLAQEALEISELLGVTDHKIDESRNSLSK